MHIDHEWWIMIFQLGFHTCFDTLKHIHTINSKCDQFGCNCFLIKSPKTPWHPLECASNYQKWVCQLLVARITIMESITNFQRHRQNVSSQLLIKSCHFIIGKGNEPKPSTKDSIWLTTKSCMQDAISQPLVFDE